jgi:hypothetical protein
VSDAIRRHEAGIAGNAPADGTPDTPGDLA